MNRGIFNYGRFQFQGRLYKKYNPNNIIYEGSFSERPKLSDNWEKKIFEVENTLSSIFSIKFDTCIIERKKWKKKWGGKQKTGVTINFTFITNNGELMWRKNGYGHGTANKIYTKKKSQFYTLWLRNPSI